MVEDAIKEGKPLFAMAHSPQWMLWTINKVFLNGKWKDVKVPIDPHTGEMLSAHDPANWTTADRAVSMAKQLPGHGVAFVFTRADPFFFLDLDHALVDGTWNEQALILLDRFKGCAIELSQSGTGLHIFGRTARVEHSMKNVPLGLECYTELRFVALTGNEISGDCNFDATQAFYETAQEYFPPKSTKGLVALTDSAQPGWDGPADDDKLLKIMLKSKSKECILTGKPCFKDLFQADNDKLSAWYPDVSGDQGRSYDGSSVDMALAQQLAFFTGAHGTRMLKFMEMSKLKRDKWTKHKKYLEMTIVNACNMQDGYYDRPEKKDRVKPDSVSLTTITRSEVTKIEGYNFLAATQQEDYFRDCIYIIKENRILTPKGQLLNQNQFSNAYGGYDFSLDDIGRKTTRNAWEAFNLSQALHQRKADGIIFRPDEPPRCVIRKGNLDLVNIYVDIPVPCMKGDATPFLEHVAKLYPDKRDQMILLSYLAAIVKYPGKKFFWAPLLQGVEGNGKTLFSYVLIHAIGEDYCHVPQSHDIDNKFNGWLVGKICICVEDLFPSESNRDLFEILKPMITGEIVTIQRKGMDQVTMENRANFVFNTNHMDAIKKTKNDRRICILFAKQQEKWHLKRDGLTELDLKNIYDWLKYQNGYAIVTDFLRTFNIPYEFDPTKGCKRAPETSTTTLAIEASMSSEEQEILEAIQDEIQGFASGWISSIALNKLIDGMRGKNMSHRKRRLLLESLDYILHPGLKGGRCNRLIGIDNGKPRLYVTRNHPTINLTNPVEIENAYIAAQQAAIGPTFMS